MADDIITAEEREEWKRIFEHAETSKLIGWKTDWQLALEDKAQDGWPRTLAALEAAEAEIERLYVLCDWWAKEEGLQRQLAEKAEAENARLRELCGESHGGIDCEVCRRKPKELALESNTSEQVSITCRIISRLKQFTADLEAGVLMEATRVERHDTPDGPMHVRRPVVIETES